MEERKINKKFIIIFLVIILILLSNLILLIVKDKNKEKEITATTTESNLEENKGYFIKETKTSKTGINVTLEQKTSNDNCNLLIDNKIININTQYCSVDYQFDLYENFIIIVSYNPNLPIINDVLILDYNGEKLTSANEMIIDKNDYINKTNDFYDLYYIYNIEVDNNKVKYNIEYYNDLCIFQGYDDTYGGDNCGIMKMKCSDMEDLGENINYISTYEIELINNKFSTPKLISSTKLKDTDVYEKAINECE